MAKNPEFKNCIVAQLMGTFMPEALNHDNGDAETRKQLNEIGIETLNLGEAEKFLTPKALLMPEEKIIYTIENPQEKYQYMKSLAEEAYVNGNIGRLRHICGIALESAEPGTVLDDIYWAIVYHGVYALNESDFYLVKEYYPNGLDCPVEGRTYKIQAGGAYRNLIDVFIKCLEMEFPKEGMGRFSLICSRGLQQSE